ARFRVAQDRGLPACSPNWGGAGASRNRLDVTKEMGPSAPFPIRRIVRSEAGARTQHAEKGMLNGIDHNPGMSTPDGQIARLRICDSPKFIDPRVKLRRARVFIRQTSALVDSVDKMGAVESKLRMMPGIQRDIQNRQTLTPSQRPGPDRLLLQVRTLTSDSVSVVGTCLLLLRHCDTCKGRVEQEKQQGAFGVEPHSPSYNAPSQGSIGLRSAATSAKSDLPSDA